MVRKSLILALLLFGILLAANAYAANCGGTTACSCGDILNASRTLNASDNLVGCTGNGLNITASHIVLDCDGNTISGDYSGTWNYGVYVTGDNVTVMNCITNGYNGLGEAGIYSDGSSGTIDSNTLENNFYGMAAYSGFSGLINNNTADNNSRDGIYWGTSGITNITNNTIINSGQYGLNLGSANARVWHNNIYNNTGYNVFSGTAGLELSYNSQGNYWGRTVCPLFVSGTDSFPRTPPVLDSYPYSSADSWKVGGSPVNCTPTISLSLPANNSNTTNNQPDFVFTAISKANTTFPCELFIGDVSYGGNTTTKNDTATTLTANHSIADGSYNWYINCTDNVETFQSEIRVINVDTAAPSVTINTPSADTGYNADFIIEATITGSPTTATYRWENTTYNDSWVSMSNTTATSWNATFDVSTVAESNYTFRINATDSFGNSDATATVTGVIIDTTSPNITSFTCSDVTEDESQSCSCTATDNSESFGGSVSTSISSADTSTTGTKSVTCTATDTAGNTNTSTTSYTVSAVTSARRGGGSASTYTLTVDIDEGLQTYVMRTTDIVRIKLDGDLHSFRVTNIHDDYISVRFGSSDYKYYDVGINETINVDIDDDDVYDLSVTLDEIISNRRVEVSLERISEEVPEFIEEEAAEEITEEAALEAEEAAEAEEAEKEGSLMWLWILIIVVVIIAVGYYVMFHKPKRKKKHPIFGYDF